MDHLVWLTQLPVAFASLYFVACDDTADNFAKDAEVAEASRPGN